LLLAAPLAEVQPDMIGSSTSRSRVKPGRQFVRCLRSTPMQIIDLFPFLLPC
jgi:hypothetical protein